jgi:hypothetical protein
MKCRTRSGICGSLLVVHENAVVGGDGRVSSGTSAPLASAFDHEHRHLADAQPVQHRRQLPSTVLKLATAGTSW